MNSNLRSNIMWLAVVLVGIGGALQLRETLTTPSPYGWTKLGGNACLLLACVVQARNMKTGRSMPIIGVSLCFAAAVFIVASLFTQR